MIDLHSGSDTARRDWLILIVGLLAGAWFFFDYGNHHPLKYADATLGSQAAERSGLSQFGVLGYLPEEMKPHATFRTRSGLLNHLQEQTEIGEILADPVAGTAFSPYYWNLDLFQIDPSDEDDGSMQLGGMRPPTFRVMFSQTGEWMEFRNPNNIRPQRLLVPDALARAIDLPEQVLMASRDDSVLLATFGFEFDRNVPDDNQMVEDGIIQFNADHANSMAGYYLEQTGWPVDQLEFESAAVVPFGEFDAAELSYRYRNEQLGGVLELDLRLSPGGSLLSLQVGYPDLVTEQTQVGIAESIRVLLLLVFVLWLVILLYIRVRLRVVDIKSAILLAVLAGLATPFIIFLDWLHGIMLAPGSPEALELVFMLVGLGFSAAFVSMIFFTVTVIGESVTRQHWTDKIRTLDLVRIGHLFNRPVGTVFIHSFAFALILAAVWSTAHWFLPQSYLSVESRFMSDSTYLAPLTHLLSIFFYSLITIQAIFLVLSGQLMGWVKNRALVVITSVAAFAIVVPIQIETGPLMEEAVLNGMIGLCLAIIYVYRDFLTALLTIYLFTLLATTADGWIMAGSPDGMNFYLTVGIGLIILLFGYIAVTRGKSIKELPKYVPDYIEDLAQEERIKQELQIARKVQQSFLPFRKPELQNIDLAAVCIPAYETGGDYYDFIELNDGRIALIVGDVSGKGFQAAFYMTFIKGVLYALCREYDSTVEILKKANKLFLENAKRGTFISLIFGIIDPDTRKFIFSRAGHNPLLYFNKQKNKLQVIRPNGLALGMTDGPVFEDNITESQIDLGPGDVLILFTDGIVEAVNSKNEFYGDKRLHRMAVFLQDKPAQEIVDHLLRDIEKFSDGANQHDDMTLLVIKQK